MIVKAAIGFLKSDSDDALVSNVQSAITGLTGNAVFQTPAPTLPTITSGLTAFMVAMADAVNGGTEMTSIKYTRRTELASLMRQLASYVTLTSDGDMTKLLSSGFPYQKTDSHSRGRSPNAAITDAQARCPDGSVAGLSAADLRRRQLHVAGRSFFCAQHLRVNGADDWQPGYVSRFDSWSDLRCDTKRRWRSRSK